MNCRARTTRGATIENVPDYNGDRHGDADQGMSWGASSSWPINSSSASVPAYPGAGSQAATVESPAQSHAESRAGSYQVSTR